MEGVVRFTPWAMYLSGVRREPGYPLGRRLGVLWCGSLKPGTHMRNYIPQFACYEVQVRSTEHSVHLREPASSVGCSIEITFLFG